MLSRLLLILGLLFATAAAKAEVPAELVQSFDQYFQQQMQEQGIPGASYAIVHKNQIVAAKGYGVREVGSKLPVDAYTVFRIASVSKTFAGGSDFVLPSRYDSDAPMSAATINQVLTLTYKAAQKDVKSLAKFGPHDLRRTASTLLHEAGYNTDWIEKCLAHEQKGVRAVYNKAEYREQRTAMLQDWADM
ncbi:MAG: hypothetical protein B7Z18_07815, partial [Alishewanella sp. 32-51-5]